MTRAFGLGLFATLLAGCVSCTQPDYIPQNAIALFDGETLNGWQGVTTAGGFDRPEVRRAAMPEALWSKQAKAEAAMLAHWSVVDGALRFDGSAEGGALATTQDFGNFELFFAYRLDAAGDAVGCTLRGWSLGRDTRRLTGEPNVWHRCHAVIFGDRLSFWHDDVCLLDAVTYSGASPKVLPLADQIELFGVDSPASFKDIYVRPLPTPKNLRPQADRARRGEPIDLLSAGLAGWECVDPTLRNGWSVKDGVLTNDTGKNPQLTTRGDAGTTHLRTKRADFFDFDLSFDVLVPKACNSGVYLRGRYEIQILDSYGARKPNCHNMAALYDLITPRVSAERPAGTWQHVDLTLYRRHLTVRLNGITIIDNEPVPGVTPGAIDGDETAAGPILLQGDHSNASFKNMRLTPILP